MNITVLGASGFVGYNLSCALSQKGFHVVGSDIEKIADYKARFVTADMREMNDVARAIAGSEAVVHLAAHQLRDSLRDPRMNAEVNILGTLNVLEACRKEGVKKIIFSSASSIIGQPLRNPVDEEHVCNPKTPYAVTKLAVEHYLSLYQEIYGLNYLVFRFFNIYGPHQKDGLIPNFLTRLVKGQPVQIFGNGDQVRDYVYVNDLTPIFEKALREPIQNTTVNIGTGRGATIMEVLNAASKVVGKEPLIEWKDRQKGEIGNFVADTRKLEQLFGTVPGTPLDDGIRRTYDWVKGIL